MHGLDAQGDLEGIGPDACPFSTLPAGGPKLARRVRATAGYPRHAGDF